MKTVNGLFDFLDSRCFGHRLKNAAACIGFLILIQLAAIAGLLFLMAGYSSEIQATAAGTSMETNRQALLRLGYAVAGGSLLMSIGCAWLIWRMVTYSGTKPLHAVNALMAGLADGRTDLSQEISELPYPELNQVAAGYNTFMQNIRRIIETIRKNGIKIAIGSSKVRKSVQLTSQKTTQQKELSEMVALSSSDANTAIKEVSENAQYVSDNTTLNLDKAKTSYHELVSVAEKIQQINQTVESFRDTVAELSRNSAGIMDIVALINNISDQTNLLSLNATIEAARAGEHGKGFAVVAEEVRTLAKRVKPATEDITDKVNKMVRTVEKTKTETDAIIQSSAAVGQIITKTSANFKSMIGAFEGTNDQLLKIAAAIEELSHSNDEINLKVGDINVFAREIFSDMETSAETVQGLNEITEKMQEMVSYYTTGEGVLDEIITKARQHRDYMQQQIDAMKLKGINVFDAGYKPIAGTNPQKYTAQYTDAFREVFQSYVDDILKKIPGAIYVLPVDRNGYLPVHHGHVSKPMTGDYEKDLLYSRHMRIFFSSQTEKRRSTSTAPMLLQTYMRDTGEVLNDLSMPIMIDGRHWGAFILGLNPDVFFK